MIRLLAGGSIAALVAVGCGTGDVAIDVEDAPPELFSDDVDNPDSAQEAAEVVTDEPATPASVPTRPVPEPRDTSGVVFLGGVAFPAGLIDDEELPVDAACRPLGTEISSAPQHVVVMLDPGGDVGSTEGAVAGAAKIIEIAAGEVEAIGASTAVTRPGDTDIGAGERVAAAEASGARVLVSVILDPTDRAEVVPRVGDEPSRRLAGLIAVALLDAPGFDTEIDVHEVLNQRGSDYYVVLRSDPAMAAVVVRLPHTVLVDAADLADAVADGVALWLTTAATADGRGPVGQVARNAPTTAGTDECVDSAAAGESDPGQN